MKKKIVAILLLVVGFNICNAQNTIEGLKKRNYKIGIVTSSKAIEVDGLLNDEGWESIGWDSDFIQREPDENKAPSEQTKFKIAYDNRYIYIAIRNYDSEPAKIVKRMSRRDGNEGDWVEVIIDSYHDLRTAFSFTVSAAGVRGDKIITDNGVNEDETWNPIWYAKSNIDDLGWTAEMKIPLTQLRFGKDNYQTWGLQIVRGFFRNDEQSVWQRVPLDVAGWVSEFGEIHGLYDINSKKTFEIQPYFLSSYETFEKDPNNPFKDSDIFSCDAGLDGKVGITNDLTLDFTINPDFGQVEADPAVIVLDGFEAFFTEQRPFFVENKNIFNYQFSLSQEGNTFTDDNLFYSRRIGRKPQGSVNTTDGEYVNIPERTKILGALKFSGKTKKGLSVGILESVTSREYAELSTLGNTSKELVEPLTNYYVCRIQQDVNNKNSYFGGIITSTHRQIENNVDYLHRNAFTGGIDFKHQWKNRAWYVEGNIIMSAVNGSEEAILNTQQSISHLFQREGASHVSIDSTKTSLVGSGGNLKTGKMGNGNFNFETGVTWRSPELELNDLGYMQQADDIRNYTWLKYKSIKPFSVFRSASISSSNLLTWDFGGNFNRLQNGIDLEGVFNNNWYTGVGVIYKPIIYSNTLLRGGPRFKHPYEIGSWVSIVSDQRKKSYFSFGGFYLGGNSDNFDYYNLSIGYTVQPYDRFNFSITPSYAFTRNYIQYVSQTNFANDSRYICSFLDQETLKFSLRFNYLISTNLSIQYYGQPFISTGKYKRFNYINNPVANEFADRFNFFTQNQISYNQITGVYEIDENHDENVDYSFSDPDFSFVQYRSNLVVRWEYIAGSELFFIWSQGVDDYSIPEARIMENVREQLINNKLDNIFLIKLTYRFMR